MSQPNPAEVNAMLRDPVQSAAGLYSADIWPLYADMIRAQAVEGQWLMLVGCHDSSKTHALCVGDLWHVRRYNDGRVICMAPGFTQIDEVIWAQLHTLISQPGAQAILDFPEPLKTELEFPGQSMRGIISVTSDQPQRLRGIKGGHRRIHVEEMDGIRPDHWDEIEQGMTAGGVTQIVAAINPTLASGPAYEACKPGSRWKVMRIHAFLTPNFAALIPKGGDPSDPAVIDEAIGWLLAMDDDEGGPLDDNAYPYLIGRRYARRIHDTYGPDHPFWQARVMAEFPTAGDRALIPIPWLEAARDRAGINHGGQVSAGLDIAGPGDDETSLTIVEHHLIAEKDKPERWERSILFQEAWKKADARGEVMATLKPWQTRGRLQIVNADALGEGRFFAQHLRDNGLPVKDIAFGGSSDDPETYVNMKAQLGWQARQAFERNEVSGLTDPIMAGQLAAILWDADDPKGRIAVGRIDQAGNKIKPKVSQKTKAGHWDRAESLMLALLQRARGPKVYEGPLYSPAAQRRIAGISKIRGRDW